MLDTPENCVGENKNIQSKTRSGQALETHSSQALEAKSNEEFEARVNQAPVSYTHLTLPTTPYV